MSTQVHQMLMQVCMHASIGAHFNDAHSVSKVSLSAQLFRHARSSLLDLRR